jgi:hypothetical protein
MIMMAEEAIRNTKLSPSQNGMSSSQLASFTVDESYSG